MAQKKMLQFEFRALIKKSDLKITSYFEQILARNLNHIIFFSELYLLRTFLERFGILYIIYNSKPPSESFIYEKIRLGERRFWNLNFAPHLKNHT